MYHMIILLLFNHSLEYTVQQIHDQTQIQLTLLSPILNTLIQGKVLICTELIDPTNVDIKSTIRLSTDFTR